MTFDKDKFESFVLSKIFKHRVPSLTVGLALGDEVYYRSFGYRDVENRLIANEYTLYGVGSVTKSFTALAIMKLHEKGLLSLDDPIYKYLPDVKVKPFGEDILIWHLLTHSSGLPALAYAEAYLHSLFDGDTWMPFTSPYDIIPFINDSEAWAEAAPGEAFFYLNEGYVLLGMIVSKVSGVPFEEFVRNEILKPIKMARTYFKKDEVEKDGNLAIPYILASDGRLIRTEFPYGITADGGLISNVVDLLKYLRMYIDRGAVDGEQIFFKRTIEEMEEPRVRLPYEIVGNDSYGYGWIISPNFLGDKLVYHSGSILVHTAFVGYIPSKRIAVAALANGGDYPPSRIGIYALALALGHDPRKIDIIRREELLEFYSGAYESYKGTIKAVVEKRGDFLFYVVKRRYTSEEYPLVVEYLEENSARMYTYLAGRKVYAEFRVKGGEVELVFERYKLKKVART